MSRATVYYVDGSHYNIKGVKVSVVHEDTHVRVTSEFVNHITKDISLSGSQIVRIPRKELIGYVVRSRHDKKGTVTTRAVALSQRFNAKVWADG